MTSALLISILELLPHAQAQFRPMIVARPVSKIVIPLSKSPFSFKAPAAAKRSLIKLWGAGGGAGGNGSSKTGGSGGGGGFVEGEFTTDGGVGTYIIVIGGGGQGGPSISPSGPQSGKGGGGGGATMLLDGDGQNPILVAAGGGGGGGALGTNGGNGGAGGFKNGADGSAGCTGTGCPTPGQGGSMVSGTNPGSNGTPQTMLCSFLGLGAQVKPSTPGLSQSDSNPVATGGAAGTCYRSGDLASVGPGGLAYYDDSNATGCTSGAGGDGRAGGGGGGIAGNSTSVGCAGGGGGAGYLRNYSSATFKTNTADGSGTAPGAATDSDLALGGSPLPGTGGIASTISKAPGSAGNPGFAIIYFY